MSSGYDLRVLLPADRDAVYAMAKEGLKKTAHDPMEAEMQSWNARWRAEALDHYLALGWSYGCYQNGELRGFLLAQPFIFHKGHTQTLWVEHVEAANEATKEKLIDCAVRWAKDKHFQRVLFDDREVVIGRGK
jgi:hypothetical protein